MDKQKRLEKAMQIAVASGMLPKVTTGEDYLRNWDGMTRILKACADCENCSEIAELRAEISELREQVQTRDEVNAQLQSVAASKIEVAARALDKYGAMFLKAAQAQMEVVRLRAEIKRLSDSKLQWENLAKMNLCSAGYWFDECGRADIALSRLRALVVQWAEDELNSIELAHKLAEALNVPLR